MEEEIDLLQYQTFREKKCINATFKNMDCNELKEMLAIYNFYKSNNIKEFQEDLLKIDSVLDSVPIKKFEVDYQKFMLEYHELQKIKKKIKRDQGVR